MSQPIRGRGDHLLFSNQPESHTNLLEDVEILLPVKFWWIPFSGFRAKVKNVSANQRRWRPSCFSEWHEKHKLGRRRWDLTSCQVKLNSVSVVLEKSKMAWPIRDRAAILFVSIGPKNTNLVEDIKTLLPVMFCWIPISGLRAEVKNVSANQRPGWPYCFSDRPEKYKLSRRRWYIASCQVLLNSVQQFQRSRISPSQSETGRSSVYFPIGPKIQTWKITLRSCFLSSFVEFNSAVSEKSKCDQLTMTDDMYRRRKMRSLRFRCTKIIMQHRIDTCVWT